jgi:uncharacterized Zn finger protein
MSWYHYNGFTPYVRVADRKKQAAKKINQLRKKGQNLQPVVVEGRLIAKSFWGKAWCKNLESYSDYSNRLPRGRSYVRNGLVIDLQINKGEVRALVDGSMTYKVNVTILPVIAELWQNIVNQSLGKIDSLIELLQGKFSKAVMEIITNRETGLFPKLKEIKLNCSCPDGAYMCKHVAAALYAVGAHLDQYPQDLFLLRQIDHLELINKINIAAITATSQDRTAIISDNSELSALFGIDIKQRTEGNVTEDLKKKEENLNKTNNKYPPSNYHQQPRK